MIRIVGAALAASVAFAAHAQEPARETPANSVPGAEKVDQILTSNSLRAMSGSLSRWSLATTWSYNGGNLASPFSQSRPNIANSSATTSDTDLDASLNGKFSFDATHSLLAGFGLRYIAPFNSTPGSDYTAARFDVLNPNAVYQYVYGIHGVQALVQGKLLQWTQADQTANGYAQQMALDQESMYTFDDTGLSL